MIPTKQLCRVIESSLEKQNLDKLKEYLSSSDSSQAFNVTTLSTLVNILKKDGKREDKIMHADCVLSCLEYFIDINSKKWLILADDIGKLCELVFVITTTYIKDESLIQKAANTFTKIVNRRKVVADSMLHFTLEALLKAVIADIFSNAVKLILLATISSMMSQSSRELRRELIPTKVQYLDKLSNKLCLSGDYEIQVAMVEVLARSWFFIKEKGEAELFTNFPEVMIKFKFYNFLNLDSECRLFLNNLNSGMGENQLVFSVPCLVLIIDNIRYKKPDDPMYKEFWIDFNVSSRSVSFYFQNNPGELWEFMSISEADITNVQAVNSTCKSKSGKVTPVIKMEIIFTKDTEGLRLLQCYLRKCKEYENLERLALKEIFQDKLMGALTFEENNHHQTSSQIKLEPVQHYAKLSQSKPVVDLTPAASNSTVISKWINESNFERFGIDSPPPIKTSHEDRELSRYGSSGSDSFSDYIKKLKKQENKTNVPKKETRMINTVKNILTKDQNEEEDILSGIKALTDNEQNTSGVENKEIDIKLERNANNTDKVVKNKDSKKKSLRSTFNTEKSKENVDEPVHTQTNRRQKSKSLSDLNNSNKEKRRRLFSTESNNIKDLVLSSQEEFSAEIPKYRLQKKEEPKIKPQSNVNRKNITFSYITEREKVKETPTNNKGIFVDASDEEEDDMENKDNDFDKLLQKNQIDNASSFINRADKKLLDLNRTPEGVEESKIFPCNSPNLFVSKKDTHLKNTYARSKPKRNNRRNVVMPTFLSDSDTDYIPPGKWSPVEPRQKRKRSTELELKLNLEGFVDLLPARIDPIRNIEHMEDEMKIDSVDAMDVDTPRKIEVPSVIESITSDGLVPRKTRGRKANAAGAAKKNIPKKLTSKVEKKKPIQIRKPRKNKMTEDKNKAQEATTSDVVSYQAKEAMEECGDNNLALDIPRPQISQESDMLESSPNSLAFFGKQCLAETNTRIMNMLTLAEKEREMHYSSYSFSTHATITALQEQKQKQIVISNNLHKAKCLLDSTAALQNHLFTEIEEKSKQLEESRLSLMENLSKVDQAQSSRIVSVFQDLGKYISNFAMSYFQRKDGKKPLEN